MRCAIHIVCLLVFNFLPVLTLAAPPIPESGSIKAAAAIIYDLDSEAILFEQNADLPIPPASTTKIMSMFLALDYVRDGLASMETPVAISSEAAQAGGSAMGLAAGETVPLGKLLLGMAVSSGNDASHAVAEYIGGSVEAFVKMMNHRARALGMRDSHFFNPHGLPAIGQQVTARDMLTLARAYLREHPDALQLHNTQVMEHGGYKTWNRNPLLGQYPGADGLKSGWIRASGYNLVFTASKNGRRLLGVILGAPDPTMRGAEACRLLDAGFLVCANEEVSVAAALDTLPIDLTRIDPLKTGRENGLLKRRIVNKRLAGTRKLLAANAKNKTSRTGTNALAKKKIAKKTIPGKPHPKRKDHAARKSPNAKRS